MTTLKVSDRAAAELKGDALVLVSIQTDKGAVLASGHGLADVSVAHLESALVTLKAKGGRDEVVKLVTVPGVSAPLVVVTGVGKTLAEGAPLDAEAVRRAVGSATRQLSGLSTVIVVAPGAGVGEAAAAAEGAIFGAFTIISSAAGPASPRSRPSPSSRRWHATAACAPRSSAPSPWAGPRPTPATWSTGPPVSSTQHRSRQTTRTARSARQ